ncbi:hypothetical protein [Psychromonas antarctica]|uniref:hypothetical protein n=1 Tax=Psychromonas antarctica TaxID=67573 RepID=UPI001EE998B6|nr:hypothetical protein [Psychromonas antarctica]MCG6202610.1 hypothetical protein [Psychromonas antarctica]
MNKLISSLIFLFSISCYGGEDLIVSSQTLVEYDKPQVISHTGSVLIMKYDGWYFSHEIIDPVKIYPSIDLTGLEKDFVKSLFEVSVRKSFPKWLSELSAEQATVFGIYENKFDYKKLQKIEIYSIYDPESEKGNVFIIEDNQIHHINVNGKKDKYTNLINSIKER